MYEMLDLAVDYYSALGTPLALELASLARKGLWGEVAKYSTDPSLYQDSETYFIDALATSFCKKLQVDADKETRRTAALNKWWEAEKQCFRTNREFWPYVDQVENLDPRVEKIFSSLRKNTARLLGRAPHDLSGRFGKGSTVMHRGARMLIPDKLACIPEMTEQAWVHLRGWSQTAWARAHSGTLFSEDLFDQKARLPFDVPLVRGNRWDSVPKNALTDRSIGIEPTLNLFYQLSVGQEMKSRLQKWNLLLAPKSKNSSADFLSGRTDQSESQAIHRALAKKASVDGSLATIDLSSASDTIAESIVHLAFPQDWVSLFSSLRSPYTLVEGHEVKLEKFSSMGNGFTFELETALFTAAAWFAMETLGIQPEFGVNLSVYGDDIIVPVDAAPFLLQLLRFLGFSINKKKTFITGPFRESCGGDYFLGRDVRPIFVSKGPRTPSEWIVMANKLYDLESYLPALKRVRNKILSVLPTDVRNCRGPRELGDVVITDDDHQKWQTRVMVSRRREDPSGWRAIRAVIPQVDILPLRRWDDTTAVTSLLYGCASQGVAPRGEPLGYRIDWVAYG